MLRTREFPTGMREIVVRGLSVGTDRNQIPASGNPPDLAPGTKKRSPQEKSVSFNSYETRRDSTEA